MSHAEGSNPTCSAGPIVGLLRGSESAEDSTFIDNVKRLIGRDHDSSLTHQLGYETAAMQDGKIGIMCHDIGRTRTATEVSSEVLKVRPC